MTSGDRIARQRGSARTTDASLLDVESPPIRHHDSIRPTASWPSPRNTHALPTFMPRLNHTFELAKRLILL